ncbi:hypothetical protein AX774_g1543 [Zancudomyces culisetae]|uniref:Uncharacterized protein n=1 Tax=Zancudomyces culisetae TaxID=1213189 RepID=A0A1R1PVE5_ZANCU|nr:hypothetical protein AX774_g1543 [Zancudomyces culisetae]|eukprot:OMH84930.1 hypothetical protein AX774_g1543 [Zancudomyces culisetae]
MFSSNCANTIASQDDEKCKKKHQDLWNRGALKEIERLLVYIGPEGWFFISITSCTGLPFASSAILSSCAFKRLLACKFCILTNF